MKHTSKYIFSFCLMFSLFTVQAQEITANKTTITNKTETESVKPTPKKVVTQEVKQDSIPAKTDRYGVRFGVDLYKLTRGFYDSDYKGVEFTGDYRLTKKYYLAGEIGTENKTTDDDRLNTTTKGTYLKIGFDYNLYENWLDMENIISVGLRYGFSTFSQELNNYKIYNSDPYWGELPPEVSGEKFSGLSASWLEVNAGVKAKVFNNVFVGFSVQLKTLVTNKKPDNFDNLYIPGFNRTYDGNFGIGFNYTVSYFIPIYKKKVVIPGAETKK
ncbi:hypothetical protein IUY40_16365 [Flavobacterium sp. ALJ2]|uniref:DUF6048 family protein n=1 Tax=Flavobacterium sp. ALJ2 TaxID=2786960 RepID=UPI00189D7196|nr:DUF6048 family protein [Flavobacterium sp. ALJ2]MBF7093106.1 hypothetical protein [Flavobacterium sp. ALJ2]